MSSSLTQLVLDFLLFAIIHHFIIFPLMTKLLGFITGEHKSSDPPTTFETLKRFINEKEEEEEEQKSFTPTPVFTITTITEEAECEKCGILLEEEEAHITRSPCHCTWCAECVQECFDNVDYDLDAPLQGLSKHCAAARNLTIRQMWPTVREMVDDKTRRYVTIMSEIDLTKNDWMLDSDEEVQE